MNEQQHRQQVPALVRIGNRRLLAAPRQPWRLGTYSQLRCGRLGQQTGAEKCRRGSQSDPWRNLGERAIAEVGTDQSQSPIPAQSCVCCANAGTRSETPQHVRRLCNYEIFQCDDGAPPPGPSGLISAAIRPLGPLPKRTSTVCPGRNSVMPKRRRVSMWTKISSVPSPRVRKP